MTQLARWSLYATAALALFVVPGVYFPYVTTRAVLFRILTVLPFVALLMLLRHARMRATDLRDPVLIALVGYLVVCTISALAGVAPWRSFFGDFERMWGVLTIAHFVLYYIVLRTFFREEEWKTFFTVVLIAGGVACAIAITQRLFGTIRPPGSLGNAGYLAIFAFMLTATSLWALRADLQINRKAILWALVMGSAAFMVAATRAAMFGAVAAVVWTIVTSKRFSRRHIQWTAVTALALLAISALLAQSRYSDYLPMMVRQLFVSGSDASGSIRLLMWESGLRAAADRLLLGWGPENATVAFNQNFDPAYYVFAAAGDRLDRFHNAYIEALATTGVLGLTAFLAIWFCAAFVLHSGLRSQKLSRADFCFVGAVLIALAVYYVFWFEDLTSYALLIALLAFLRLRTQERPLFVLDESAGGSHIIAVSGAVVLAAYLIVHAIMPLRAAYHLERADADMSLDARQRIAFFQKALHPAVPQRLHTLLLYAGFMRTISRDGAAIRQSAEASAFVTGALNKAKDQVALEQSRDPLNDIWPQLSARLSLAELAIWRSPVSYYSTIRSYEKAIAISPDRVRHRLALAKTFMLAADTTRGLEQLRHVQQGYPEFGETYAELAWYYSRRGASEVAATYLQSALDRKFTPEAETVQGVVRGLAARRDWQRINTLVRRYFELQHGANWISRPNAPALDRPLALALALSAAQTQQHGELNALTVFANRHNPLLAPLLNRLQEDVARADLSGWSELVASQ